jgi:hypothetical protein
MKLLKESFYNLYTTCCGGATIHREASKSTISRFRTKEIWFVQFKEVVYWLLLIPFNGASDWLKNTQSTLKVTE